MWQQNAIWHKGRVAIPMNFCVFVIFTNSHQLAFLPCSQISREETQQRLVCIFSEEKSGNGLRIGNREQK